MAIGAFSTSAISFIQQIGIAAATGVLLDAFVVRMALIPALMHLAGNAAWWLPRWLDRILPDIDVEGASLERRHPREQEAGTGGDTDGAASTGGAPAAGDTGSSSEEGTDRVSSERL